MVGAWLVKDGVGGNFAPNAKCQHILDEVVGVEMLYLFRRFSSLDLSDLDFEAV